MEKGVPSTKMAIRPSNKLATTVSGLSVDSNCGKGDHGVSSMNSSM